MSILTTLLCVSQGPLIRCLRLSCLLSFVQTCMIGTVESLALTSFRVNFEYKCGKPKSSCGVCKGPYSMSTSPDAARPARGERFRDWDAAPHADRLGRACPELKRSTFEESGCSMAPRQLLAVNYTDGERRVRELLIG